MTYCGCRSRSHSLPLLIVAAGLLVLPACSAETDRVPVHPVQGSLWVGGEAAEGALVVFHPITLADRKTTNPNGRVQADGSFNLSTYETGDGAPANDYVVTVFWPEPPKSPIDHPHMGPDRLQNRYTDPSASQIRVSVQEGENRLDPIRLDAGRPSR